MTLPPISRGASTVTMKTDTGYGVGGSTNIVVTPDHVEFGDASSAPFTVETHAALAEFRGLLECC